MKFSAILSLGALAAGSLWATNSRVDAMGKSTTFFMDDAAIFDNASNIGLFPNFLIGEFGTYDAVTPGGDPQSPWFGGIFSYGFGDEGNGDPRGTIGGVFNRRNEWEQYLPDSAIIQTGINSGDSLVVVPKTITNFDGFLGGSTSEGNLYGAHIFVGVQDGADNEGNINSYAFASIIKADVGINWQLPDDMDFELSAGLGRIAFGDSDKDFWDLGEWSLYGEGRIFSTIEAINGEFVGAGEYSYIQTDGREVTTFAIGPGVNVSMDLGFFWLGLQGFYQSDITEGWERGISGTSFYNSSPDLGMNGRDKLEKTGGRISFGIERNIWADWFVIRVGGQKEIAYSTCTPSTEKADYGPQNKAFCGQTGNYWSTNAYGDATSGDHIGFGFGLNVEEKLKVDFAMSESTLFLNPFTAPEGATWVSRISASYSF
jgi:hypothetical protein